MIPNISTDTKTNSRVRALGACCPCQDTWPTGDQVRGARGRRGQGGQGKGWRLWSNLNRNQGCTTFKNTKSNYQNSESAPRGQKKPSATTWNRSFSAGHRRWNCQSTATCPGTNSSSLSCFKLKLVIYSIIFYFLQK